MADERGPGWQVRGLAVAAALAWASAVQHPAEASNGAFLPGYGGKSLGLGGGGAALPEDSLTLVANVAGLVHVGDGVDLGVTLYSPWTTITVAGNAQDTDLHWFPAPSFGLKRALRDDLAFGFAIYGNGGIGYDYEPSPLDLAAGGGRRTGIAHTDRVSIREVSLLATPGLAWRASPEHAFGAALLLAYQSFNAKGLGLFGCFTPEGAKDPACSAPPASGLVPVPSREPDDLTNHGNAYQIGAGLRVGWLWQLHPRVSLGVGGSTRVHNTRLKKYRALLPDHGSFDLPPQANAGLAWRATERVTVVLDYQKTFYESVAAYGNRGPAVGAAPRREQLLGNDRGFAFGWRDQNIYKLGVRYQWRPDWVLRTGFNYGPRAVPRSQLSFALLNPALTERSAHVGFTHRLANGDEITMAAFRGFKERLRGTSLLGPAEIAHEEYAIAFSYHWR
jgi:long-chain fatty acid transport protein